MRRPHSIDTLIMKFHSRKPLIFWCRWNDGTLRIRGTDGDLLTGQIEFKYDKATVPFNYHPDTWILNVGRRMIQLDEMGVEQSDE